MTKDEALKQAMEALERALSDDRPSYIVRCKEAITAIKEALMSVPDGAQPAVTEPHKQEPVAWTLLLVGEHHGIIGKAGETFATSPEHYRRVDVYTTPPQRKPLSDEEIRKANYHMVEGAYDYSFKQGVKWAEYKHGIKD